MYTKIIKKNDIIMCMPKRVIKCIGNITLFKVKIIEFGKDTTIVEELATGRHNKIEVFNNEIFPFMLVY